MEYHVKRRGQKARIIRKKIPSEVFIRISSGSEILSDISRERFIIVPFLQFDILKACWKLSVVPCCYLVCIVQI
jgi:hypothetical protein